VVVVVAVVAVVTVVVVVVVVVVVAASVSPLFNYIIVLLVLNYYCMSRDSSAGIVTGYGQDGRGKTFFSALQCPNRPSANPASFPMGTGGSFPGAKAVSA
jgi:hypothetical protein